MSDGLIVIAVGLSYYVAARLGLRLSLVRMNVTPLWPPTGIALAALIVYGRRAIPGIAGAAFLVNAPISPSLGAAALIAAGNTLAPVVAARLLRAAGFRRELDRLRDALAIIFIGGLAGMLISATVGSAALLVSRTIPLSHYWPTWAVWWTGDALGVIVVAPLLLTLPAMVKRSPTTWLRRAEASAFAIGIAAMSLVSARSHLPVRFVIIPIVAWTAFRFKVNGAVLVVPMVTGVAIWAAIQGIGAFSGLGLFDQMFLLQGFSAVVALSAFIVASLVTDRDRAQRGLQAVLADLEDRVRARTEELQRSNAKLSQSESLLAEAQQVARVGSWEWDVAKDEALWSEEMYRLLGVESRANRVDLAFYLSRVHPDDRTRVAGIVKQALADRGPFQFEHRVMSPDGDLKTLHCRGEVICGTSNDAVKLVGIEQDITDRVRAEEYAQRLLDADARRRQALELNDEIVQGLAIAKYALDCSDNRTAFRAVERTLMSTRLIVSKLLDEEESPVAPGDLTRGGSSHETFDVHIIAS